MTTKVFSHKTAAALMACAFIALTAVGCKKDQVEPIIPDTHDTTPEQEPNFFIYGDDTLTIDQVTRKFDNNYGMHTTTIELTNGDQFNISSIKIPDGDFLFTNLNQFYTSPDSVLGAYHQRNQDNYLWQGTFSAHYLFNTVVLDIQGITYDQKVVSVHYNGPVTDISNQMGTGTLDFGGRTYRMNLYYCLNRNNFCNITFTNTAMDFAIKVQSRNDFLNGKVYTISDNETDIANGNAIGMTITAKTDNGPVTATATSGALSYIINNNGTVTINYNGSTSQGQFSGNYSGEVVSIVLFNK